MSNAASRRWKLPRASSAAAAAPRAPRDRKGRKGAAAARQIIFRLTPTPRLPPDRGTTALSLTPAAGTWMLFGHMTIGGGNAQNVAIGIEYASGGGAGSEAASRMRRLW